MVYRQKLTEKEVEVTLERMKGLDAQRADLVRVKTAMATGYGQYVVEQVYDERIGAIDVELSGLHAELMAHHSQADPVQARKR